MNKLGNKIRSIRKKKGLAQKNLHDNQSAVAQIERGINKNPTPDTLRTIAENLDVSFEELVKDTDWKVPQAMVDQGKYGYSELDFDLIIKENGKIEIDYRRYPRYDTNGMENKFCPITASKLLFECKECKKPIGSSNQIYCMGCGNRIFQKPEYKSMDEFFSWAQIDKNFLSNRKAHNLEKLGNYPSNYGKDVKDMKIIQDEIDGISWAPIRFLEIKGNDEFLNELIIRLNEEVGSVYEKYHIDLLREKELFDGRDAVLKFFKTINDWISWDLMMGKFESGYLFNYDDYMKGVRSNDPICYDFHIKQIFRENFLSKMVEQLKIFLDRIVSKSIDEEE